MTSSEMPLSVRPDGGGSDGGGKERGGGELATRRLNFLVSMLSSRVCTNTFVSDGMEQYMSISTCVWSVTLRATQQQILIR